MESSNKIWYENWFNSPYYHILYKDRDHKEAESFITRLNDFLNPPSSSLLLDVACGKGRHALYLSNLGYNVDAFDLSPNNISHAKKYESDKLHFYINDIRKPLKINHYDFVFNLFTSFGYFNSIDENQVALNAMSQNLKSNGVLVLDFMNCEAVLRQLPTNEEKRIGGLDFMIRKKLKDNQIIKQINFEDKGKQYAFEEQVRVIDKAQFESFFEKAGLEIEHTLGDYDLSNFDKSVSERLIFIARKK